MGLLWLSWGAALYAVALGALVFWRAPRHPTHVFFGIGMLVLAVETVLAALGAGELRGGPDPKWLPLRLVASAFLAAPWLAFSRSYSRGDAAEALRRRRLALIAVAVLPVVVAVAGRLSLVVPPSDPFLQGPAPRLGSVGVFIEVLLLLTAVAVLTQLERTFRGAVGVMRWRIKYMILGVGALFGFRLYAASQALLYRAPGDVLAQAGATALIIGCILITVALARGSVFDVDVYPSQALIYGSLTVLLAGTYLLIVGVLSHLVTLFGGGAAFSINAFLILVALVGLAVILLSERLRQQFRHFVSRHLRRPVYDYRRVWSTFTAQTTSLVDEATFCRAVASWSSSTFQALSASVWLVEESGDRLRLGGSTVLVDTAVERIPQPPEEMRPALAALAALRDPTVLEPARQPWAATLERLHPGVFPEGGRQVCQPLATGGKFLGVLTLGDRVAGLPFTTEEFDLLKCVGDQVAASLLGLQLSARLIRAKEMEAFQTMSTFFVHDLKNTASTLSLTLQNLHRHFGDPAFRDDALRAVGKSVQHLNDLIARLSRLRQELRTAPVPGDLCQVADRALAALGPAPSPRIRRELTPIAPVLLDAEQLEKVVVNLLHNAREAVGADGEIQVATGSDGGWGTLSVTDNGCGMSPEFMRRSLFRPFQTTKKNGLGIGMFHSKMIIEALHGRLEVDSSPGRGTTVRIRLPLAPSV